MRVNLLATFTLSLVIGCLSWLIYFHENQGTVQAIETKSKSDGIILGKPYPDRNEYLITEKVFISDSPPSIYNDESLGFAPGSVWFDKVDFKVYRALSTQKLEAHWVEDVSLTKFAYEIMEVFECEK